MALQTQKGSQLPEGAVPLTSEEALNYQWKIIKNWPSEAEVLSIKFGRHIAAATSFFSSAYLLNFFKKTLNVTQMRFTIASLPGVVIPTIFTYFSTDKRITNSVLLMKLSCPLCDQLKFAATQFYLGLVFPALYGYGTFTSFASFSGSFPIPNINTHAREFWKFSYQILKQGIPQYQVVGLFQIVLIMFLPYFQNKQLVYVMNKSRENEYKRYSEDLELNS